jgi:hypothetical protein
LLTLNAQEKDDIVWAIGCWSNYIETGDINLSAQDAKESGKYYKALTFDQMEKLIALRKLSTKILTS